VKLADPASFPLVKKIEGPPRPSPAPSAEILRAARDFEQIFLRKMLSVLEKTGRPTTSGSMTSGSDIYSSMVVNALAESVSAGGGIGLGDFIAKSVTPEATSRGAPPEASSPGKPTPAEPNAAPAVLAPSGLSPVFPLLSSKRRP
jgi:Rod binding domain-containing protein